MRKLFLKWNVAIGSYRSFKKTKEYLHTDAHPLYYFYIWIDTFTHCFCNKTIKIIIKLQKFILFSYLRIFLNIRIEFLIMLVKLLISKNLLQKKRNYNFYYTLRTYKKEIWKATPKCCHNPFFVCCKERHSLRK